MIIKSIVQMLLNHWQAWGINHLFRQPVPVFGHPIDKEMIPNVQFNPPLLNILLDKHHKPDGKSYHCLYIIAPYQTCHQQSLLVIILQWYVASAFLLCPSKDNRLTEWEGLEGTPGDIQSNTPGNTGCPRSHPSVFESLKRRTLHKLCGKPGTILHHS